MIKPIQVIFKQFDNTMPKPKYHSPGAVGIDLYARLKTKIPAGGVGYVPLNIALQLPEHHWALIAARSSLHKRGLMMVNGIGVGDYDYSGPDDEYQAALYNFTNQNVVVEKGERIVQLIVMAREPVNLKLVNDFETTNRGGFGSTGRK
jgi:dUTP pyrophosphatase